MWLILSVINPLLLLIFWTGVSQSGAGSLAGWSLSSITTYYLLLIFASSFLITHRETDIAVLDIQEGGLVSYLLKPFSYFLLHFFGELGWRVMQGSFAVIIFLILSVLLNHTITSATPLSFLLSFCIIVLGYVISFTLKFLLGLSAFWVIDFRGIQQIGDVLLLILAGFIMPISLFPPLLEHIALLTPFPYMVYFPVISLQGELFPFQQIQVITVQLVWLSILFLVYKVMWRSGIKKFTGVGQ